MPPKKTAAKNAPKKLKKSKSPTAVTAKTEEDDFDEWKKSKQLLKPKDQLELSDADLKEEVPRVLLTNTLQVPDSIVQFSSGEGVFIPIPFPTSYIIVYSTRGTYIPRDSDEARKQMARQGITGKIPWDQIKTGQRVATMECQK